MKPTDLPTLFFESKKKWADWLAKQHDKSAGVWLKLARKDSGISSVAYEEALDVSLCYGWIDGQKKGFDDKYWLQKFTPRGPKSIWSKINTEKAERLIASGEMKPAGLKAIEAAKQDGRWDAAYEGQKTISVSRPTIRVTRTIRGEQVRNAFGQVVRRNLPLELKNTRLTTEDILDVLGYAHVQRRRIESVCQALPGAPSGNRLREVLVEALPDRSGRQRALNRLVRQQLQPSLWKCKPDFNMAMDLRLISDHGQPYDDKKEIVRSTPKSGTTHFHGYATISIVRDHRRIHDYLQHHPRMIAARPASFVFRQQRFDIQLIHYLIDYPDQMMLRDQFF